MQDALPLLYQSGYLTIKGYDRELESYTLSIPNQEVRIGYARGLLPAYIGINDSDVQMGFAAKFWRALKNGDVEQAMQEMRSYMSGIPYIEGFKQKLQEAANGKHFHDFFIQVKQYGTVPVGTGVLIHIEHETESTTGDVVKSGTVKHDVTVRAVINRGKAAFCLATGHIVEVTHEGYHELFVLFVDRDGHKLCI